MGKRQQLSAWRTARPTTTKSDDIIRSADISDCGLFRWSLRRSWGRCYETPREVAFVGLNPSTADGLNDDPTIRRCIGFAREWGFTGLVMLNLFAFRATNPEALFYAQDPVGPLNNDVLARETVGRCVVACWGANVACEEHTPHMRDVLRNLDALGVEFYCLGKTKHGYPRHPLYVPAWQRLEVFNV